MLLSTGSLFGAGLAISGTPVTTATEDSPYAGFTATASGGVAPLTFSLIGSWPTGITVGSSTGIVSGTPTIPGSYTGLSVRVTDNVGSTADLPSFTLTVGVSGATRQFIVPTAYINRNGPRQSIIPGAMINEG